MLGAITNVVRDKVVLRPEPTARGRSRKRYGALALALLPLLAACTGAPAASPGTTITVAPRAPVTTPPIRTTLPPTTLPSTTSTAAAPATTTVDTAGDSQYGAYTVQADLSLSPTPTELHQVLWDLFRRVLGDTATAQYIEGFTVYNDLYRNADATVLDGQTPGKRQVLVNARYADDLKALARTFIHEYGHLVTLSADQMTGGGDDCGTTSTDEGCLAADSYLNGFLDRFWWSYGQEVFDALSSPTAMDAFYAVHQSDFVTRYAATDPLEDIAEVWAEFVINDAPAGTTVAEQKILYLYGFPELVELREQIRQRVGDTLGV
ncbi:MAG TPA: hypothetical protein PLP26_02145 [Ilumatobacteraceae bacterium]|nr:hypothetical protein [Ilumatobacteraceae bacterium]